MTANAVANYLKKKILLVTVSVMMERDLTKVLVIYGLFKHGVCVLHIPISGVAEVFVPRGKDS